MAEPPPYPGRPRWVKAALLAAAVLAVLLVLVTALGGGRHGPGRHVPGGAAERAGVAPVSSAPADRRS